MKKSLLVVILFLLFGCQSDNQDITNPPEDDKEVVIELKPFPYGIYESASSIKTPFENIVEKTPMHQFQKGILVKANWNLCGDDINCLLDTVEDNLNLASNVGIKVSLVITDGNNVPNYIKEKCKLFKFDFRGKENSFCLPWDSEYLSEKESLIKKIAERFDNHDALSLVYFTASCSTNGAEGHCRINEEEYIEAGYTLKKQSESYVEIMNNYIEYFKRTPIAFEIHTQFDSVDLWSFVWESSQDSKRVGVAAWWCSERMSLNGNETQPTWDLLQAIASQTFSICQTVGNFTSQPYRFTDISLNLNYGEDGDWNDLDALNAFNDTMDWSQGIRNSSNVGNGNIIPFSVVETWTKDINNSVFSERYSSY